MTKTPRVTQRNRIQVGDWVELPRARKYTTAGRVVWVGPGQRDPRDVVARVKFPGQERTPMFDVARLKLVDPPAKVQSRQQAALLVNHK